MTALLIVVAYLATTVLPAAYAMRWARDYRLIGGARCTRADRYTERECKSYHRSTCWMDGGEVTPRVAAVGMTVGLFWPVALVPVLSIALAARKPSRSSMERRIRELEQENDL